MTHCKPWPHQSDGIAFALNRPATMIGAGMGVGKSRIAYELATVWGCKRTLVICPPSVRAVHRREVAKWCPEDWQAVILDTGTVLLGIGSYRRIHESISHGIVSASYCEPFLRIKNVGGSSCGNLVCARNGKVYHHKAITK